MLAFTWQVHDSSLEISECLSAERSDRPATLQAFVGLHPPVKSHYSYAIYFQLFLPLCDFHAHAISNHLVIVI